LQDTIQHSSGETFLHDQGDTDGERFRPADNKIIDGAENG
jgi:hypothetical protein